MRCSSSPLTTGAEPDHFNGLALDDKPDLPGAIDDGAADRLLFELNGGVAFAADQELALMGVFRVIAADKSVQRGDTVHEAVFQQEIQRAVYGWRRGAATVLLAEDRQYVVSTQRLVALPHQFQHSPAQGRQAQALTCAQGIGLGQSAMDAMRVVVGTAGNRCFRHERRRVL
ncbi:hypothetical protein EMIT0P253_50049 [Pseudomonas sp. IT-P253]